MEALFSGPVRVLNRALAARARGEKVYLVAGRFAGHAAGIAAHLGFDGVRYVR